MYVFCPNCKDKVEQNEKYCNKCGFYLGSISFNSNSNIKTLVL